MSVCFVVGLGFGFRLGLGFKAFRASAAWRLDNFWVPLSDPKLLICPLLCYFPPFLMVDQKQQFVTIPVARHLLDILVT